MFSFKRILTMSYVLHLWVLTQPQLSLLQLSPSSKFGTAQPQTTTHPQRPSSQLTVVSKHAVVRILKAIKSYQYLIGIITHPATINYSLSNSSTINRSLYFLQSISKILKFGTFIFHFSLTLLLLYFPCVR